MILLFQNKLQHTLGAACAAALLLPFCFDLTATENTENPEKQQPVTTLHRSASETFTEKVTGIKFPAVIDSFSKVMVRSNRNELIGTTVSYENEYGSFADVYIYAADPEGKAVSPVQFVEASAVTIRNIETMAEKSKVILKVERLKDGSPDDLGVPLPSPVQFCRFRITTQEETVISHLLMFLCKGRIIKIRITYPGDVSSEEKTALTFSRSILDSAVPQAAKNKQ